MPSDSPLLETIPNVELCAVGTWEASTGPFECTAEDLAAAVQAQDDPAVRTPIVKLGHVDPRFDAEPAVGRIENMRVSEDGMTLLGDLVGVPAWLAEIVPSAYPSRSIEGCFDYRTATGSEHRFVITGLALLGVQAPAVEVLEDIATLFGVAASDQPDAGHGTAVVFTSKETPMPKPATVTASVSIEQVRSAFYDTQPQGSWAWIREVWSDFLIVDNDDGDLFKVPWSEDNGTVVFGAPEKVQVEYVPAAADGETELVLLGRAPLAQMSAHQGDTDPNGPEGQEGAPIMDATELRKSLGLAADATDDEVKAKLDELNAAAGTSTTATDDTPEVPTPKIELPDGVVAIDEAQLEELTVNAAAGKAANETLRARERDELLDKAVRAGKFPPARIEHYRTLFDKDPDGTREFIDTLAAGLVPVDELGTGANPESSLSDEAIWAGISRMSPELFATDTKEA